jgi:hypothetical protein
MARGEEERAWVVFSSFVKRIVRKNKAGLNKSDPTPSITNRQSST